MCRQILTNFWPLPPLYCWHILGMAAIHTENIQSSKKSAPFDFQSFICNFSVFSFWRHRYLPKDQNLNWLISKTKHLPNFNLCFVSDWNFEIYIYYSKIYVLISKVLPVLRNRLSWLYGPCCYNNTWVSTRLGQHWNDFTYKVILG